MEGVVVGDESAAGMPALAASKPHVPPLNNTKKFGVVMVLCGMVCLLWGYLLGCSGVEGEDAECAKSLSGYMILAGWVSLGLFCCCPMFALHNEAAFWQLMPRFLQERRAAMVQNMRERMMERQQRRLAARGKTGSGGAQGCKNGCCSNKVPQNIPAGDAIISMAPTPSMTGVSPDA